MLLSFDANFPRVDMVFQLKVASSLRYCIISGPQVPNSFKIVPTPEIVDELIHTFYRPFFQATPWCTINADCLCKDVFKKQWSVMEKKITAFVMVEKVIFNHCSTAGSEKLNPRQNFSWDHWKVLYSLAQRNVQNI